MATSTQTIYGKQIKFGTTELDNCIIIDASLSIAKEVKTYTNHKGAEVSGIEFKHKVEASINATMLQNTAVADVEASVKTWLATKASESPFNLATGGTVIVSSVQISESNEDAAKLAISATYYPDMVAETV